MKLPAAGSGWRSLAGITVLLLLALGAVLISLHTGSVHLDWHQVVSLLVGGGGQDVASRVLLELRLPRVLGGFLVGGMLALAGALMQVLLRNPLAEPYVLGVSGGAAVFALLAISLGLGSVWIHAGAFAGALVSIVLVFALSRAGGEWYPMRVLLTGVVVAAGWGAVTGFILSVSQAAQVRSMLFWLMGDLGQAGFSPWNAAGLGASLVLALLMGRSLNLLARGELQAAALGVAVQPLRAAVYFLASLLTAAAVMQAGSVGFIGLVVPHMVRLTLGSDHRVLLPASVLLGGSLLVIADTLARTVIAPQQLPVGILTAMLGVPVFLVLLRTVAAGQRP